MSDRRIDTCVLSGFPWSQEMCLPRCIFSSDDAMKRPKNMVERKRDLRFFRWRKVAVLFYVSYLKLKSIKNIQLADTWEDSHSRILLWYSLPVQWTFGKNAFSITTVLAEKGRWYMYESLSFMKEFSAERYLCFQSCTLRLSGYNSDCILNAIKFQGVLANFLKSTLSRKLITEHILFFVLFRLSFLHHSLYLYTE